jgi:hypothetical protein
MRFINKTILCGHADAVAVYVATEDSALRGLLCQDCINYINNTMQDPRGVGKTVSAAYRAGPMKKAATPVSGAFAARCYACDSPSVHPLPRYEHDGAIDHFHPTCVGGWLMRNPDSVINFYTGTEQPTNANGTV